MLVKLLQPQNASLPMLVTEFGIVIPVKLLQPLNASLPMLVTEFGITVFLQPATNLLVEVSIIALQLLRLLYTLLLLSTMILVKLLQSINTEAPMLVTESGIVMPVKLLQCQNAELPILVTGYP